MDLFDLGEGFSSLLEGVSRIQCPTLVSNSNAVHPTTYVASYAKVTLFGPVTQYFHCVTSPKSVTEPNSLNIFLTTVALRYFRASPHVPPQIYLFIPVWKVMVILTFQWLFICRSWECNPMCCFQSRSSGKWRVSWRKLVRDNFYV